MRIPKTEPVIKPMGILYRRNGHKLKRVGESIIFITSTVPSNRPGSEGVVLVDNDVASPETYANMVGELLIVMEQQGGGELVAQAIAHYAAATGKIQYRDGLPDVAIIRHRNKKDGEE